MNWKYKAALQLAVSHLPFGERLNHLLQRHLTKSLPTSDGHCRTIVTLAKGHLDLHTKYLERPLGAAVYYEFGAGWDLTGPMAFWCCGVNHQVLVDIRKLIRIDLLNDTIDKLRRLSAPLSLARAPNAVVNARRPSDALPLLKSVYGIDYRAPCDAAGTGLPEGSIDCITSTNTLEHIPPRQIQAILRECGRLLRPGGVMSFRIDYQDHYSYFDGAISPFNFLRFSDRTWALFNPALGYQNRLRHRDYLELFQAAGFELLEEQRADGTPADVAMLGRLHLDRRFSGYAPAELAVHDAFVVLRKRRHNNVSW